MAYRSRSRARTSRGGSYRRAGTARRSGTYRRANRRVGSRVRSRNSGARTVRIVIEQPGATLARPDISTTTRAPKKAKF